MKKYDLLLHGACALLGSLMVAMVFILLWSSPSMAIQDDLVVEIQHDGSNTDEYAVTMDDVEIGTGTGNLINGTADIMPGGKYVIRVEAKNPLLTVVSEPYPWEAPGEITIPVIIKIGF